MASKMTRAEKERRQAAKQNEKAKKKEEAKKGKSNSSSSLNLPKLFDEPKEKKSFAQRFAEDTRNLSSKIASEKRTREAEQDRRKASAENAEAAKNKKTWINDEAWRNPMTKTGVSMPDNIDVTRGNSGRTREELERRDSQRELSQMTPDKWMKASRETVGLKDNEKAGVGLGTIQHGTLNKNAELFSSNWDLIPQGNRVDAAIQIIYTYGINDQNRDMVMSAFNGASTYDKRKIMDAAVQTVGWNDVTYGMKQSINNAPDAKEALMQQISEDMNVRNGNYLDTFKREANKAVVDQYNLQQKEDKIITDWAKENYDFGEAIKMATLEKGGSMVAGMTDSVAFGVSDLLQIGQQDNVLDGVNPFEGVKNTEGFGNKIARVGTNVLHDLFRLTGINVSLFSKAFLNEREVREITDALTGITDPYYEAVRNNMVALEGSNLSESQKTAVEIYGSVIEQIPSIVMAVVASPAAGLATIGVTAGGKYARSAYEQGATLEEAVRFGLAGAATEIATEKMFPGFGYFGKSAASKVLNETTKKMLQQSAFPNSMSARILKRVVAGGGEASEEMIAELVQPFLERSTYNPGADNATLEEVLRSGGIGFAVAQILGLPANALGVTADVLQAYDTKAQERVINDNLRKMVTEGLESGRIDEAAAANINAQVSDIRKGKGVLTQSEAKEETKVTGENLDKVYSDFAEAREAMKAEAKGMKNGETVRARVMKDGEVKTWETEVVNGSISPLVRESVLFGNEKVAYNEKAKHVASATNTAERTGYQLNVKDEIVKEVSALSKAFNREVEFYYDKNSAVHGNVDLNTGKIYVNVNSSQSPAAAVIAHEMTHLLENTSSYKTLTNMMQKYYASSLDDKRNEIISIYKSNPKAMKTILDENDKIKMDVIDSEVMAAFIEEKLLTDYNTIRELTRTDRTLAQKIVDWINKVIQKITGSREQKFLIEARDVWNKALQENREYIAEDTTRKVKERAPEVEARDKRYSISRPLKESDLQDYLRTGKRRNKNKQKALDRGEKIILTNDGEIRNYIEAAIHGNVDLPTVAYAKVNKELSDAVKNENKDFDIKDFYLELVASDIYHAYEMHKESKESGDIPLSEEDFMDIPNLIENFDEILDAVKFKSGKSEIVLSSKTAGGKAIIVETVSLSRNSLLFKNMWGNSEAKYNSRYNKKRSAANSGGNQNGSTQSPRFANTSIDDSITDSEEKSKERFSIGSSKDAAYMDAVNRGDMNEAQRMVDEAAEVALANSKIRDEEGKLLVVYHGTEGEFTVFDRTRSRANMDIQGNFFSPWEDDAAGYGSNVRKFYLNISNPASESIGYKTLYKFKGQNNAGVKAREELERLGYDGVNNEDEEYIAFNPNQIKSADPVTYDDDGNIIPLSARFNEESDDIRWSIGRPTDTKAERKDAEEADRLYDAQLEDVIEDAPELAQEELRSIDNSIEYTKEQVAKELAQLADNYREGKGRKKKAKRKGGGKDLTGKLRVVGNQGGRKIYTDKKKDDERRELRLKVAEKWFKQNEPKTKPGSAKALYFKNRSAMELMDEFRRGVMTYLVERDMFIPAESGGVVVDEHNAEIATRDTMTGEWDISRRRNTYTPSLKLTYLAEAEGLDVDQFHTMYSQIKFRMEHINPNGERHYKRKDVVAYINSLNITSKQKWFLYFDVAGYARSTAPAFASYGPVKEEKGNQRGNMIKALDNIAVDMFAGAMKDPDIYDGSHRITHEDILAFADTVYGKEDTKAKEEFMLFFTGRIITYADKMMEMRAVERTNLLTDKPKEADPYKAKILRIYRNLKKELIAEGEAFERMADKLNNPLIRARYYDAKKSLGIANEMINGKHQRNINGEVTGKGLHEIFKPVFKADEKAGNNNMMTELTLLVNCRHDIDRLKYDKGYTGYTAEECEAHIERISREHKWLVDIADELVQYSKNLLQMCVDCGRISEEDQRYFNEKYPYYVPTFRLLNDQYYDREGNIVKRTNSVIKTAVGGTEDVLPLFDQLVRRTQEIVKACKKNQLATELAKTFTNPKSAEYIINIDETVSDEDKEDSIDKLGAVEELGRNRKKENGTDNIIPWYCAGVQHDIIIADENMLYGWDRINYMRKEAEVGKIMRKINAFRRAVLTQYNPTFFLTNHIKDVNDMFLYNQHAERLPKYYALAWKTMVGGKAKDGKNRDYLEEYLSHGMAQTSIFEYDLSNSGRRTKKMKAKKVLMALPDGFNEVNFIVEQVPRLAVYMETVDRLESQRTKGGNTYTDEEIKTIAGYQASDATLNFGRSGTFVKAANTYGCTFLNAGVQGMDRFRRMFTQIKDGNKQAVAMNVIGLVVKSILLGLGSNWILDWIYGGDDEAAKKIRELLFEEDADRIKQEYLEMADYQRLNYFLFAWPFGEQETWIRIPRGRVAAYFYSWAYNGENVFSGEMDALELIQTQWDMAKDTILPPNPVYENIIGPFLDVARNKDAWGEEIVTSYEDQGEGYSYLEYDEDTTDMAIMLAEFAHKLTGDSDTGMSRILDISPKKLDYIVEQYLGSYADLIMPMMNKDFDFKSGTLNALESLAKKFYIDPTLSNRLAGDYYDLSELYQNVAAANEDDTPYAVSSEIFATVNTQLKPLREASKEVSKATSMTRGEAFGYLDDLIAQAEMSGTDTGMIEEFRDSLRSNGNTRGDLSRKEIQQLNRVIKDQMNQIYRTATSDAKSLQEYASANYYGKDGNADLYKEWYRNNKSAEWQITKITANSENTKEGWENYSASGGDAQTFVDFYNFCSITNSTYDKNGDQVRGFKKKDKCMEYLNSFDISAEQKKNLYLSVAKLYSWGTKKLPRFTDGASGNMPVDFNLSHPLGEAGEVSLSFMVDNNGHTQIKVAPGTAVGAAMVGSVDKIVRSEKYGDSIFIKSTDKNGNTIVIQYYGLEEVGGNHEGGAKKYDYIEAGDMIGKAGKDGLKFKVTVNGKPVDAADYLDLGKAGTIKEEGYTTTKIGEEERDDEEKVASSGGGYGGGRGGSGGSGGGSVSIASSGRNSTNYDSVTKLTNGQKNYNGSGVMLPTAAEIASMNLYQNYGAKGTYLPKASDYNNGVQLSSYEGSVPTTPKTTRTGTQGMTGVTNVTPETQGTWRTKDKHWDDTVLS